MEIFHKVDYICFLDECIIMIKKFSKQTKNRFYQSLGKVFYAVAASDKGVSKKEFGELKTLVKDLWLDVDTSTDEFEEDAAYQIEIVFDYLASEEVEAEQCFQDFKDFKLEYPKIFSKELIKLIWQTCDSIATSFYGLNQAELRMLHRVKKVLGKP